MSLKIALFSCSCLIDSQSAPGFLCTKPCVRTVLLTATCSSSRCLLLPLPVAVGEPRDHILLIHTHHQSGLTDHSQADAPNTTWTLFEMPCRNCDKTVAQQQLVWILKSRCACSMVTIFEHSLYPILGFV